MHTTIYEEKLYIKRGIDRLKVFHSLTVSPHIYIYIYTSEEVSKYELHINIHVYGYMYVCIFERKPRDTHIHNKYHRYSKTSLINRIVFPLPSHT